MTDQEVKSVMVDNVKLGEDGEQARNALMESIKAKIDKKNVQSLCNKILKKCSFKSETDLDNISNLAAVYL